MSVDESIGPKIRKVYTKKPTMFKQFKMKNRCKTRRESETEKSKEDYRSSYNHNVLKTEGDRNEIESELPEMVKIFEEVPYS